MASFIKKLNGYGYNSITTCFCDNCRVAGNLAMRPRDIAEATSKGMPASQSSIGSFYDGDINPVLDPLSTRGVDIVDAWELSKSANQKLVDSYNRDIKLYGN